MDRATDDFSFGSSYFVQVDLVEVSLRYHLAVSCVMHPPPRLRPTET